MASIQGCHLVGSVPLADTETVFRKCLEAVPSRLRRIPDGETGSRHYFTAFQAPLFSAYPRMMVEYVYNTPVDDKPFTPEEIDEGMAALEKAGINTGYDDAAIESYAVFRKLREEGVIPKGVRFQVCFPAPANTIIPFVQRAFLPRVEPLYEQALHRAMRRVQDEIPHQDLAIQIDLAVDTAFWEASSTDPADITADSGLSWFKPWWSGDVKERSLSQIIRMVEQVAQDVELGLHNCYGDMNHKHWHEPASLAPVVDRGIQVMKASPHKINWFHCPVPKSALERQEVGLDAYLAPLTDLRPYLEKDGTELYLGLVHENRPDVTQQMIEAASKVVPTFGIATECGGGRMEWNDFEAALKLANEKSAPCL